MIQQETWFDKLPSGWQSEKLKHFANYKSENISVEEMMNKTFFYYDIPTVQAINDGRIEIGENIDSNKQKLSGRELLISKLNPRKRTVILAKENNLPIVCSTEFVALIPKEISKKYLYYILGSEKIADYLNKFVKSATKSHQRVNPKDILNITIPVPPVVNQNKIVGFLDRKVVEIEKILLDKMKLINLLEQQRQSIITEAVTKGLNPNVKMKDSGVEWIGEIPEHWDLLKIKHLCSLNTIKADEDSNLKYVGLENIESKSGRYVDGEAIEIEGAAILFEKGDILFGKLRPYLAKVIYADFDGRCSTEILVMRANDNLIVKLLLKYVMLSPNFIDEINSSTYGSKMPRANWGFIGNTFLPVPPKEEQKEIVDMIMELEKNNHKIIEQTKLQIKKLKQYRQSLIYEAVTGKIDVRDMDLD